MTRRIVSLVPSLTETIADFGLQEEIVGCTTFCVHPTSLRKTAVSIGGTKDASLDIILDLKPTHIITNDEENKPELISDLRKLAREKNWKVLETNPRDIISAIGTVNYLGNEFQKQDFVKSWKQKVHLELKSAPSKQFTYAYFIWREPWMVAGNKTYISELIKNFGGKNIFETSEKMTERYPSIEATDAKLQIAQYLLFSSEPFPFKTRHIEEFLNTSGLTTCGLKIDGQNLSWFGTRLILALQYMNSFVKENIK